MKRGYEVMLYPDFYKQLGYNATEIAQKSLETLIRLFGV